MHLAPLIIDLALILAVAGTMSLLFQKIRQPVVLGYILAGVIVGPYTPPSKLIVDIEAIHTWAELGVIFLMFTLGLEFSFRKLLSVGATAVTAAFFEVAFFLVSGFLVGRWLGWSSMDSLFLGAMLSISSTTIIIKALEELKLKNHRFAGLIFGILIVEDLFAVLLLVGLTTIATNDTVSFVSLFTTGINLGLVVGGWFITGYFLVPRLIDYVAKKGSNEMITLVSIGLCLALVVLASHFGYSPALGAFIMGSILAESGIIHRIESLMGPLKDLFGAIFFVSIGMLIDPNIMWKYKEVILLLSAFTILGKIISTGAGSLLAGQSFKNSVQVGMGLAQIGEFSFIIAGLGVALKATSEKLYPIGVAVSLVTTFTTPYFIRYSGAVATKLESWLSPNLKSKLQNYMQWNEFKRSAPTKNQDVLLLIAKWLANGVIMTLIFRLALKGILPYLGMTSRFQGFMAWLISFVLSLPFVWGMLVPSKKGSEDNAVKSGLVFIFPVLTTLWISVLSMEFFSLNYILPVTILFVVIIYLYLYRRLETSYMWFERTYLQTFQNKKDAENKEKLVGLAPWDSHLASIEVHPNASLVNKTLLESQLRNRWGINVVAIQRGIKTIVAPTPRELILPRDKLIVLGTDEELDLARPELDMPEDGSEESPAQYKLRHLILSDKSTVAGLSIRQSGIREKFDAMVVGLERNQQRTINPDTDMVLEKQDVLWVVGEELSLNELIKELS